MSDVMLSRVTNARLGTFCRRQELNRAGGGKGNVMPHATARPTCPVCQHSMNLKKISPGRRGFEERTFACSTCSRTSQISLPVDPLRTDAVGWLASELRPPQ
jgi:hypothetical protein